MKRQYPIEQSDIDKAIARIAERRKTESDQAKLDRAVRKAAFKIQQKKKMWKKPKQKRKPDMQRVRRQYVDGNLTLDEAIKRLGDDKVYSKAVKGLSYKDEKD